IAQINIDNAGLTDKAKIIVGPAITTLSNIKSNASFDLAFIDADKQSNIEYFIQAKRLVRKGGCYYCRQCKYIGNDPTTEATTLRTVGEKGYDGFLYAVNKPQHQLELHFMTAF
ncbi:unnamed protein product, partial [Rotaria magnacalcarata]